MGLKRALHLFPYRSEIGAALLPLHQSQRRGWWKERSWNYDEWGQVIGQGESGHTQWWKEQLFFPIIYCKDHVEFLFDSSKNLWKITKGMPVTTKTNIPFTANENILLHSSMFYFQDSLLHEMKHHLCEVSPCSPGFAAWQTVIQEYQIACVKLCSWHECKLWCQKIWPFVGVELRSKKQGTDSW